MERQKEIEIYIRGCPDRRLLAWIESRIGHLDQPESAGDARVYASRIGPVIVTAIGGAFTGVWFNTANSPWATDIDCAREAARYLMCVVRCDPGRHFNDVPERSDTFLEIEGDVERLVDWA